MANLEENKLTLKTFFETIKKAGNVPGSRDDIAIGLYHYAGINVSDSKIRESVKGRRPPECNEVIINEAGFLRYFKERTVSTWRDIQKMFYLSGGYSFINCDTQDADDFYRSLLDEFYDLLRIVPISLCHCPPAQYRLIGRENELEQLTHIFEANNYAVLIGVGGIGKSRIASAYAHKLDKKGGWIIQYIICEKEDTLRTAINRLKFNAELDGKMKREKDIFNSRIEYLKKTQKSILIVLDNLNWSFTHDNNEDFKKLRETGNHIRILITTRKHLPGCKEYTINIQSMKLDSLLDLYEYYRFDDNNVHKSYIAEHKDILERTFSLVCQHTLMVEILAKLAERCFLTEEKIYEIMNNNLKLPSEKIFISKDNTEIEITEKEMLKKLFDISQLTDTEKSIMQYMSMIPFYGVEATLFVELTGCNPKEIFNLKKGHWIMENEETSEIYLHPLICEMIFGFDDIRPSQDMCAEFCKRVVAKCKESLDDKARKYQLSRIVACIVSRVYFLPLKNDPLFYQLKSEYRDPILYLQKFSKTYSEGKLVKKVNETPEFIALGDIYGKDDE